MANLDEQLFRACDDADWTQAAFLLEAGAGTEWRSEGNGTTAIMWAAYRGSLETVMLLFNRGANIHARSNTGRSALMYASCNNRSNVVSYLADKGADIHVRNNDGWNALMEASWKNHADIVSYLADKGTLIWAEYNEWAQKLLHNNISV